MMWRPGVRSSWNSGRTNRLSVSQSSGALAAEHYQRREKEGEFYLFNSIINGMLMHVGAPLCETGRETEIMHPCVRLGERQK
jgi:hypothetical protein